MSGEAGAALPRAMTGKGLLRLLLRQGDARYRYEDPEVTPVAARPALAAIANLVARAGAGLEYRPPFGAELARVVAHELGVPGWTTDAGLAIGALGRSGLIVLEEGAVRLPIAAGAPASATSSARIEANRRNAMYAVKRRSGESEAEYQQRKAEHRARVDAQLRAQGHLMLPVAGGSAVGAERAEDAGTSHLGVVGHPNLHPNANPSGDAIPNPDKVEVWGSAVASAMGSPDGVPVASRASGVSDSLAAAAAEKERLYSPSPAAAAASGLSRAGVHANPNPNAQPQTQPHANVTVSDAAVDLARDVAARFGWLPGQAERAPAVFQRALNDGYSTEQIRELVDEKLTNGVSCRGPGYLVPALADLVPAAFAPEIRVYGGQAPGRVQGVPSGRGRRPMREDEVDQVMRITRTGPYADDPLGEAPQRAAVA